LAPPRGWVGSGWIGRIGPAPRSGGGPGRDPAGTGCDLTAAAKPGTTRRNISSEDQMGLRERILADTKEAMKAKDTARLSTLRLISAAIKDREIAARGSDGDEAGLTDADLTAILSKMVKQRQESAKAYEEGGRLELAERELDEIKVIQSYLPRQLDEQETRAAVDKAIADLAADSIRDMGRVMAELRARHAGQMDFGAVGPMVKDRLMK